MSRFQGQQITITGGANGIGLAVARLAASQGAKVAITDRDPERLRHAGRALEAITDDHLELAMDVRDLQSVESGIGTILERFGPVDGLVTSAGVLRPGSATSLRLEDWDETYAVNVRGTLLACRAVLPGMLQRQCGGIVLISSTSGFQGEPDQCAYNSSKAAVINLARQLAVEYAQQGIRVNCVCPGWVDGTGFNEPVLQGLNASEVAQMVADTIPMGRQGTPDEVAAAVCFLLSTEASYITGHALCVDGGDCA